MIIHLFLGTGDCGEESPWKSGALSPSMLPPYKPSTRTGESSGAPCLSWSANSTCLPEVLGLLHLGNCLVMCASIRKSPGSMRVPGHPQSLH